MTIKRIDGHGCNDSCYNYCMQNDLVYCRATKQFVGIERGTDQIAFWYKLIQSNDVPLWCPLGRSTP